MIRLEAPPERLKNGVLRAPIVALPSALRSRLDARGLEGSVNLAFDEPPPRGSTMVSRAHPLVATLAEALLEGALDPQSASVSPLGRAGAWVSDSVTQLTIVALVRIRFKLTVRSGSRETLLLTEEATTLAWTPTDSAPGITGADATALLEVPSAAALPEQVRLRILGTAVTRLESDAVQAGLAGYARARADALSADHARLREAARMAGEVRVEPVLPVDLIGVFALLPKVA
jgi:hypothetical protein